MSEPRKETADAQNLDLGALGDALGALDDQVKSPSKVGTEAYKLPGEEDDSTPVRKRTGTGGSPQSLSPSSSSSPTVVKAGTMHQPPTPRQQYQSTQLDAEIQGKVKAIKGMFPTMDEETIAAVLTAENGDEESAVNILLTMSDPASATTYAPPSQVTPTSQDGATSHLSSDEALARALAMEQDEAFARATAARDQRQGTGGRGGRGTTSQSANDTLRSLFGGGGGAGGSGAGSGRGGGGASSFFNDLKQSVQPFVDAGKAQLATPRRDVSGGSQQSNYGGGGGGGAMGAAFGRFANRGQGQLESPMTPTANSYDQAKLAYQPRVRKPPGGAGQAAGAPYTPTTTTTAPARFPQNSSSNLSSTPSNNATSTPLSQPYLASRYGPSSRSTSLSTPSAPLRPTASERYAGTGGEEPETPLVKAGSGIGRQPSASASGVSSTSIGGTGGGSSSSSRGSVKTSQPTISSVLSTPPPPPTTTTKEGPVSVSASSSTNTPTPTPTPTTATAGLAAGAAAAAGTGKRTLTLTHPDDDDDENDDDDDDGEVDDDDLEYQRSPFDDDD